MRPIVALVIIGLLAGSAVAEARGGGGGSVTVRGYTRSNGTYVAPYHRTAPDSTRNNNYSTEGNINPYTGEMGTKPRDSFYAPLPAAPAQNAYQRYLGQVTEYNNCQAAHGTSCGMVPIPP